MITIDLERGCVTEETVEGEKSYDLDTQEAFCIVSRAWLRCGWDNKYVYSFTWMGRPVIQLPEDLLRIQEVIWHIRPDIIIETGVAHGGSAVFYASLCKAMNKGRVIAIDIEIRPHNRTALEEHELIDYITLIEGSSIGDHVVDQVKAMVAPGDVVMVLLDSNHTRDHVLSELRAYGPLVSPGSYIVAMDGIMSELVDAPRSSEDWGWNNPREAARIFSEETSEFVIEAPKFLFNEGNIDEVNTYSPDAWLKRL